MEHIQQFQKSSLRVNDIPNDRLLDIFIGTLKDKIQHEVCLFEPTSLEMAFRMAKKFESKNMVMTTKRFPSNAYRENNAPSSNLPKPTRLTPQQMDERRAKGLCFNCDSKYSKGHKCSEKKLFYIYYERKKKMNRNHLKLKK